MDERPTYDEKLARILRESAAVFAEKGYHRASIRDIAAATGVSLSGLYYYFSSKEELLFLIQEHCFGTILERLREDLERVSRPQDRLRLLVRNHLRFFANNMKEMKVLSVEADALSGDYARRVAALKREYARMAQDVLEAVRDDAAGEAAREGTARTRAADESGSAGAAEGAPARKPRSPGRSAVDPKVATFSLFGMLNWIYTWYRPERDVAVHRLADEMTHIFLNGLLAPEVAATPPETEEEEGDDSSIWRTP